MPLIPLGDREGGDRRAKTLLRKPGDLPARTSFGPADGVFRDGETGLPGGMVRAPLRLPLSFWKRR